MPGDPKECRQRAAHCIELANAAKSENDKRRMMELAATWVRLADELDRAQTIIAENIALYNKTTA